MLNIVIPMAGEGSRFKENGYTFPKPLIDVMGKSMIQWVIENLEQIPCDSKRYIFICKDQHYYKYNLEWLFGELVDNFVPITINNTTEGAACTVLKAKSFINNNDPLIIANSDQWVEWNQLEAFKFYTSFSVNSSKYEADGCILTFNNYHPKWSYVKTNSKGLVTRVAEKKVISNLATTGIYGWKHGSDFVKYAKQMIDFDHRVNGEFYVCPVFNEAIIDGKKIITQKIDGMYGMGTPEDLKHFIEHGPF